MSFRSFCMVSLILACLRVHAGVPGLIPMRVGAKFGYCDADRQLRIPAQFDDARPFAMGGAVVQVGEKWGYIDEQGRWLIPAVMDDIQLGLALRLHKGTRYALAGLDGCQLSDFDYDGIYELRNGFFLTDVGGLKGLLDREGRLLVPNAYEHIAQLRDNQGNHTELFMVRDQGKQGIYNRCGERMQAARFARIDVFQEGYAVAQIDGRFGLIDIEGQLRVPCQYDLLQPMSEGLCAAKLKNRWGFINARGQEVIPFLFDAVQEAGFFQGRAAVNKAGNWVFVQRNGEVEFPLDNGYQSLGNLAEGLAAVCKLVDQGSVKYGYVDVEGKLRIPYRYERAEAFRRGFAIVGASVAKDQSVIKEIRYGIIDRNGRLIVDIDLRSQSAARLKRDSLGYLGFTTVSHEGRQCKVDSRGHRFECEGNAIDKIQREWMSTRCENGNLVAVSRDGLWGFCDSKGKLVIPCISAAVQCFEGGIARVWPATGDGKLHYYIDELGNAFFTPS